MFRRLFYLCALFLLPLRLLADGSSGDVLLSPDYTSYNKKFGGSSDTYDRDGWYATGTVYARQTGAAPAKSSAGTLCYDFPNGAESISSLSISCGTASSSNVSKSLALDVVLVKASSDTEETVFSETISFSTTSTSENVTISGTFDTPIEATGLRLSNSGDKLFEIASVSWSSAVPKLEVDWYVPTSLRIGATAAVTVNAITGGSGEYVSGTLSYNDDTTTFDPSGGGAELSLTAPTSSQELTVTLTVTDSYGTTATFTKTCNIVAALAPSNLTASDIDCNSLTLSWKMPMGATPSHYVVTASQSPEVVTLERTLQPTWSVTENGDFQTSKPIDLTQWSNGFKITSLLLEVADNVATELSISTDGGETWKTVPFLASQFLCGGFSTGNQSLLLRFTAASVPGKLTLYLTLSRTLETEIIANDGQALSVFLDDLPTAATLDFTVTARYADGSSALSSVLTVEMSPLPPFTAVSINTRYKRFMLTWPETELELTGEANVYADLATEHNTPSGLYLTRVYFTKAATVIPPKPLP